ncbi:outer membrane beta-barrel protein [Flavihumibacter petaseus]|uniref:Outer membrane protein beta-barrel domain-containing protein n=1 Tax=Flavihumibacter petaseus NBRC 106054 TaxID=1220578 RepID=A0A0E9MTZ1_9BACT|nr:outer membrane beta-barrel protein [Flavihumibacter petaseus]GAO41034.1 hypothetical protein FPE01S_01_00460 [Flavihumibacter petaseus NBRC 106054]
MRALLFLLLLLLLAGFFATAQVTTLKGVAFDSTAHKPLADATVTLLLQQDSSLVSFTLTDGGGRFDLKSLPAGRYRLLVTHVAYHNYSRLIDITGSTAEKDLGMLFLSDKSKMLDSVTVVAEAPPVLLLGDTVQYNANSFRTLPNANVEQLLKKMPGITVGKDGTVKAQGRTVNRVLVDGKEFFGNDPKIATKNLPADAIDKVQVYDRLSDQAQLTGFDDGNSEKTINLTLKKDKKKGYFGSATAGAGTAGRYEGKFNLNSFKGARQFSAIAAANNTNAEAFSFMDMMNFTGELKRMLQAGNGNINISADDAGNAFGGFGNSANGINSIAGAGINYNNMIGRKIWLTSNYFGSRYSPYQSILSEKQYMLPDSSYFVSQLSDKRTTTWSHRFNFSADIAIDSFHSIKISPSFGWQSSEALTNEIYRQRSKDGLPGNEGFSNNLVNSDGYNFRTDFLFRKKFRKRGRTFSAFIQTTGNGATGNGHFLSDNSFTDTLRQQFTSGNHLNGYSARIVYTEPLWRRSLLEGHLSRSSTRNASDRLTYDYNATTNAYDQLNDSLTNDFSSNYSVAVGGLRLRTIRKKFQAAVGLSWQQAVLEGDSKGYGKDSAIRKSFYNFLPNARVQYQFSRSKSLQLQYRPFTQAPSIQQLQPLADISNPLYIKSGNPFLRQELTHAVQLNYNGVNPFRNRNIFIMMNLIKTDDKIVNADSLLPGGVTVSRPVNASGIYFTEGDFQFSLPVRRWKATVDFGTNAAWQRNKQLMNGATNLISTTSAGPYAGMRVAVSEKIEWSLRASIRYNHTQYSLQPDLNTRYFSQYYETALEWQLPHFFQFSTDFNYTVNNRLSDGFNAKVPLWSLSVSRQFMRFQRAQLSVRVQDLLNRNQRVERTSNQNYIEDKRTNTLRRYALLSFTYNLQKNGAAGGNAIQLRK